MLVPHRLLTYLSISHLRPWQVVPDAAFLAPLLPSLNELHLHNERAYQRLIGPLSRPLLLSLLHTLTLSDSSVSATELILLFQDVNFPNLRSLTLTSTTATYVARLGTLLEVSCTGMIDSVSLQIR